MAKLAENFNSRMDTIGEQLKEKNVKIPIDLTAGIVSFLIAAVIMVMMPSQVAVSESDIINGRAFPTLLMWVMLICSSILIIQEIVKIVRKQPLEYKTINLQTELKALVIFGILLGPFLLSKWTGLFVIGAIFCSLGFLLYFRCKKPSYYVITLTLAVLIWAAFRFVLNVDF